MAGALTANAVTVEVIENAVNDEAEAFGVVRDLSPVDGANNVLLTAALKLFYEMDSGTLTLQWYRCRSTQAAGAEIEGVAVGPEWTIAADGEDPYRQSIAVYAVDNRAGVTSAYALAIGCDAASVVAVNVIAVDVVLFD